VNNLRKVDPQDITAVIHALGVAADEIERLRAALERIEALEHTDQSDYKKSLGSWAIAKDALESSPPETTVGTCKDRECCYFGKPVPGDCACKPADDAEDMANIGRAFMKRLPAGYCWNGSPTEYVTELENQLYDLKEAAVETKAEPRLRVRITPRSKEVYEALVKFQRVGELSDIELAPPAETADGR
jgi:hypothetical protein